jgi:hypothetical protein
LSLLVGLIAPVGGDGDLVLFRRGIGRTAVGARVEPASVEVSPVGLSLTVVGGWFVGHQIPRGTGRVDMAGVLATAGDRPRRR